MRTVRSRPQFAITLPQPAVWVVFEVVVVGFAKKIFLSELFFELFFAMKVLCEFSVEKFLIDACSFFLQFQFGF